jgi:hypothetical protein
MLMNELFLVYTVDVKWKIKHSRVRITTREGYGYCGSCGRFVYEIID